MKHFNTEQLDAAIGYIRLCILENAIRRRSRIDKVRAMLVDAFTSTLERDEDVQHMLRVGNLAALLENPEAEKPYTKPERKAVLDKLRDYEHADFDQSLKQAIASWSMTFRLGPLTIDADTLNYEDILLNLESKRDAYMKKLTDSGVYMTHEELLVECHELLDVASESFVNVMAVNLFEPRRFSEFYMKLHCKAVDLFTAAHDIDDEEGAHEYMYGHVVAPFSFMSYEKIMEIDKNIRKAVVDS